MGRWEMIKIDDLTFDDRTKPIGTGAFGEVYRGKWRVPKRVLNLYNLTRGTSLDVAIKVIRTGSTLMGQQQQPLLADIGASDNSGSSPESTGAQLDARTSERISAGSNLEDILSEAKVSLRERITSTEDQLETWSQLTNCMQQSPHASSTRLAITPHPFRGPNRGLPLDEVLTHRA